MACRAYNYMSIDFDEELAAQRHVCRRLILMRMDFAVTLSDIIVKNMDMLKSTLFQYRWLQFEEQTAQEASLVLRMVERLTVDYKSLTEQFAMDWIKMNPVNDLDLTTAHIRLANLPFTPEVNKILVRLSNTNIGLQTLAESIRSDLTCLGVEMTDALNVRRLGKWFDASRNLNIIAKEINLRKQEKL